MSYQSKKTVFYPEKENQVINIKMVVDSIFFIDQKQIDDALIAINKYFEG